MAFPNQKDLEEPLLREIAERGGEVRWQDIELRKATARYFPELTEEDLALERQSGERIQNKWENWHSRIVGQLRNNGEIEKPAISGRGVWRITDKGRKRIGQGIVGTKPAPGSNLQPEPDGKSRHEALKQIVVAIGTALEYQTSTEESIGPVGHRHDIIWRPGLYKKDPSHVVEICDGGSIDKDFAALNWVREHLGVRCLLVVTDDRGYEKARQMFVGHPEMRVVMADTVESVHKIMTEQKGFMEWLFEKR